MPLYEVVFLGAQQAPAGWYISRTTLRVGDEVHLRATSWRVVEEQASLIADSRVLLLLARPTNGDEAVGVPAPLTVRPPHAG